jgi:hypothetical protein
MTNEKDSASTAPASTAVEPQPKSTQPHNVFVGDIDVDIGEPLPHEHGKTPFEYEYGGAFIPGILSSRRQKRTARSTTRVRGRA